MWESDVVSPDVMILMSLVLLILYSELMMVIDMIHKRSSQEVMWSMNGCDDVRLDGDVIQITYDPLFFIESWCDEGTPFYLFHHSIHTSHHDDWTHETVTQTLNYSSRRKWWERMRGKGERERERKWKYLKPNEMCELPFEMMIRWWLPSNRVFHIFSSLLVFVQNSWFSWCVEKNSDERKTSERWWWCTEWNEKFILFENQIIREEKEENVSLSLSFCLCSKKGV